MAVHLTHLRRDPAVPVEQVHVMLYSYFPQVDRGQARPFVWRLIQQDSLAMLSAVPARSPACRAVRLPVGVTLDFALTYKRVRNVRHRPVEVTDPAEMRERLIAFAAARGIAIGYVRISAVSEMRVRKGSQRTRLPLAHAVGKLMVTDLAAAERLLAEGGPGTGRAYGLGMWWLPEIMGGDA